MLNGVLRANFNTGAAFDTVVDIDRRSFTRSQLVDLSRTIVDAVAVPFASVVLQFNCDPIALPCFYSHFVCLLCLLAPAGQV